MVLWFVGLNACVFGLSANTSSGDCPACHDGSCSKSAPGLCDKYNGQEIVQSSHSDVISLFAASLPVIDFLSFEDVLVVAPQMVVFRTTHPPGEQGFTELVLQQSLFTQAPPLC